MKVILLSSDGSWFHNLGAAAAKALSPRVDRVFTTGGDKSSSSFDLRLQFDFDLIDIRSEMYLGANPWIALKVIKITLKSIRDLIGNQCSSNRNGDVWQNLGARKTSLAAAFCTC